MKKSYIVYCHISPSGKRYIGITAQDPKVRWKNGHGYEQCSAMWNAVKKYGWENFQHIILERGLTKDQAEAEEIRLISEWETMDARFGYNISSGGKGANCGPRSDAVKAKMSAHHKGKKPLVCIETGIVYESLHSAQVSLGISLQSIRNSCNSGHATMRGIHFAFLKDVSTYDPQKTKTNGKERAVVNLDTGERFETLAAAAKSIGINSNSVQCVCARKPHCYRAGGFRWAYAENAEAVKAEKIPQMQAKKVLCIETGEIFKTTGSAAKAKGLKHGEDVRRACKSAGRCKAAGFHWKYVEEVS